MNGNAICYILIYCYVQGYQDANLAFYCDPTKKQQDTLGNRNRVTGCCLPMPPDDINVHFKLYMPGKGFVREIDWRSPTIPQELNNQKHVTYYAHGFLEQPPASISFSQVIPAMNQHGWQVILVDWSHGQQGLYAQSIANLRTVGKMIGHMILTWKVETN